MANAEKLELKIGEFYSIPGTTDSTNCCTSAEEVAFLKSNSIIVARTEGTAVITVANETNEKLYSITVKKTHQMVTAFPGSTFKISYATRYLSNTFYGHSLFLMFCITILIELLPGGFYEKTRKTWLCHGMLCNARCILLQQWL